LVGYSDMFVACEGCSGCTIMTDDDCVWESIGDGNDEVETGDNCVEEWIEDELEIAGDNCDEYEYDGCERWKEVLACVKWSWKIQGVFCIIAWNIIIFISFISNCRV